MQIILAAATGLYVFLFVLAIISLSTQDRRRLENRLKDLIHEDSGSSRPVRIKKVQQQRTPLSRSLSNQLIAADMRMRPEEYVAIWILAAFIASFFNTRMGIAMLITGAVMETIGFLAIKRVVTIKY